MATAGDGAAYESVGGGGGVGGKSRKRPFRRPQKKPYDRPHMAVRSSSTKGWLSKLVDPASKLISASAHFFFPSFFHKRLPPPPALPPPPPPPAAEANREPRDRVLKAVTNNPPIVQGPVISDGCEPTNSFDSGGLSELEQMLNQKSFTRSETEQLMELLHSRIVDIPNVAEDKGAKANYSESPSAFGRQDGFANNPRQESRIMSHMEEQQNHESILSPVGTSRVFEEDVAAPAELAKAYMGRRPPKVSPSILGLHSQALKEDANVHTDASFTSKYPVESLVQKQTVCVGVPENGFVTPRSRGRSAIYNMARTPYHGHHPTAAQKDINSPYDAHGRSIASSQSKYSLENGAYDSKKSVLKRRSSILDDDIGPVRRLRQKTNLSTLRNLSVPVSGIGTGVDATLAGDKHHVSSVHKLHSLDECKHRISRTVGEDEDKSMPSTSHTPVPSKSMEMATKILLQLEKLAPKDKSSEGKLVPLKEKPPSKLTLNMLRGQALRSLEDLDSSKILQTSKDTYNLKDMSKTSLPDAYEPEVQRKAQENGSRKFVDLPDTLASAAQSSSVPVTKTADSVSTVGTQPAQKKWAFQMSAHEEFLDLDDDIHFSEDASAPLAEGKKKIEMSVGESKILSSEAVTEIGTSTVAKFKSPDGETLNESADLGVSDGTVDIEKMTVFTSPCAPASGTTFQSVVANYPSTSAFDKIVPAEQSTAIPFFNSSPRNVDMIPSLTFSSSSAVNESPGLKLSASLEPKPESLHSSADVPCATDAPKVSESDRTDKNMPKFGDTSATSISSALSSSPPSSSILTFGSPRNSSCLINGSLDSKTPICSCSAPVLASSNSPDQTLTNSSISVASSSAFNYATDAITSAVAPDSNSSSSASVTSIPALPIFKFGSDSVASLNVMSAASAISWSEATDLKDKSEKETTFTTIRSSTLSGSSSAMPSTGSSIFGFDSSSSFANNITQGSLLGTNNLVSTQMSPVVTGVVPSTSIPIQFGSSSSSPIFGTSGTASFSSSSSELSSSTSSTSLFSSSMSSSSAFGSSASSSSSFSSSASIGSVFTSSSSGSPVFDTSTSSSSVLGTLTLNSSVLGTSTSSSSVFGTSAPSSFVFGTSSASSSVFGTLTSSSSVFGSSTSSSSVLSSSTSSSVFGSSVSSSSMFGSSTPKLFSSSASFGLSSTVSLPETNSIGSAGVTSSPFGSSWQLAKPSVFGSTFNTGSSSTGFLFGASSASGPDTNSASMSFGLSTGVSSGSMFSFPSTGASASSQPQPVFGSSIPAFTAPAGNGEHMSVEDSMAEDPVLSSTPTIPILGQSSMSAPGFMFGSTVTASSGVPFQFGGIPNQLTQPSSSSFQASGSLDFTGSSSFSLGSGGADKSNRKMVKVKHKGRRR
ncbi:hypothetical protein NMG60_11008812 [Bertholletia excelsa]